MPTPFSHDDLAALAAILKDAAKAEIMPRFRRLDDGAIRHKSSALDLVTDADEAAERRITAALAARFPGCVVVGEEAAEKDRSILTRLADAELSFVVDPVDGTWNFAAGLPLFAVMAAAIVRGEIVGAVILDPVIDSTALALRGHGAWTEAADGARAALRVAPPAPIADMVGALSFSWLAEPLRTTVAANAAKLGACGAYRCAGHEYRLVASGRAHTLLFAKLMPWDHAPGWLIHQEAGGYSARFDGSPYLPSHVDGGLLLAPDEPTWRLLARELLSPPGH